MRELRVREKGRKPAKKGLGAMTKAALVLGAGAVLLAAVLLAPSPKIGAKSGVQLFGDDPEVEVFGPELPKSTVGSYPVAVVESVVLPEATESTVTKTYVYASDDQECYHRSTCKFAFASGHKFTVQEAQMLGYRPCGRCDPPTDPD